MKRFIAPIFVILTVLLFGSCSEDFSEIQKESFIKFYGSYQRDAGNDVVARTGGGYALTGVYTPVDSIPRMVLIMTDEFGNQTERSPVTFGDAYQTSGHVLLELSDGFIIGGALTDTIDGTESQDDAFLVRTDAEGQMLWSRRYGEEEEDERISHLAERSGGGFVAAGKRSTGGQEQEDVWIFMVDENGDFLYELSGSDSDDDDEANFLLPVPPYGYLAGCTYDEGALEGTDYYLIFLDQECGIISTRTMGTEDDDYLRSIVRYNGGYLLMGYTENTSTSLNEIRLYRFEITGNQIKNVSDFATISQPGADLYGEACVINANGEVVIAGSIVANENQDMALFFRLESADGTIVQARPTREFGELGSQSARALKNTPGGGLIFVGSNGLEGNSVISLVKTNASGEL